MQKRGQVTIFIILGIVVLFLILLITVFKDTLLETKFGTQTDDDLISTQVESIRDHVENCIEEQAGFVIEKLGDQGGDLEPGFSKYWQGDEVSYLCYVDNYTACYNRQPFLIGSMEDEITNYVQEHLRDCVDFSPWISRGYEVQDGDYVIETKIGDDNIIVIANYPIIITRGDSVLEENRFSKNFNVPLGKLARVAKIIVDKEMSTPFGQVNTMAIIALFHGEVEILRHTHLVDEVYVLKLREDLMNAMGESYKFQFAVRGWVRS